MKRLASLIAFLSLVLLGWPASAATITITVGDNFYSPQTVTVRVGDVVTWHYQGGTNSHPTASDNGAWTTFTINSASGDKSVTFTTAGSFPYHCEFHGAPGIGMYGVITVATALAAPPPQVAAAALRVYPNPAGEVVTLRLDHAQVREPGSVQLVNMLGSVVRTLAVRPQATDQELVLNVADLPAGLYFYRLLLGSEVVASQRLSLVR